MTWFDELTIIRRFLRDPDGNIWTEAFLRRLFNDAQKDVQTRTSLLEDARVQRVPGLYHASYMHDWEWNLLGSTSLLYYRCLSNHDDKIFCHRWEPQVVAQIDSDVGDYGVHFTHPWEAFMGQTPGEPVRMKWPPAMRNLKFIAYDEKPLTKSTRKNVQSHDSSYITRTGDSYAFYEYDDIDDSYVLYPRPSTSWVDELDENEGPAWFIEDDTEDVAVGTIGVRVGSWATGPEGASFDITDTQDNVMVIFDVDPADINSLDDESDYPDWMTKYLRYYVVARAYGANTDGRIPSLSEYWMLRYEQGIRRLKRYRNNRSQDRVHRLTTGGVMKTRKFRHPRLPAEYPATKL